MNSNGFARRFVKRTLVVLAVVLLSGAFASVATACPTCSQALADEQHGQADIVAGYFWSIIFMMSMPFLMVTSFSGYMYLEVRKARAAQAQPAAESRSTTSDAGSRSQREFSCEGEDAVSFDERTAEPAEAAG